MIHFDLFTENMLRKSGTLHRQIDNQETTDGCRRPHESINIIKLDCG